MQKCLPALAAAVIFVPGPGFAQDLTAGVRARLFAPTADIRLASPTVHVKMRGTDRAGNRKCPYFQVYVNGKGPFTFLYDTGAAYLSVSDKVVAAAAAPVVFDRGGKRDVVQLNRIILGGIEARDVWAIRDDMSVGAVGVDGVMGFPTLGNANVLFDFSRREIIVSKRAIPMRASFSLHYEAPLNVPTVPVQIGGRTVPILIDTGDDAYGLELRSADLAGVAMEYPPKMAGAVMNNANVQMTSTTVLRDPVVLGPVKAVHPGIAVNDDLPVSDFGYDVLKQFRFQIDPKRRVVEFQPLFRGKQFRLRIPGVMKVGR